MEIQAEWEWLVRLQRLQQSKCVLHKWSGHWKHIEDINRSRCTQPTNQPTEDLQKTIKGEKAFFRHHYPNQSLLNNLTEKWLHSLYTKYNIQEVLSLKLKHTCRCKWGMPLAMSTPNCKAVYHYPIHTNHGDIASMTFHNRIVTPQQLHQWSKRQTVDCPWCPGVTATLDHIFFVCPWTTTIRTR